MDMGIKGSNNEPQGTNKMALLDAHSHDKDDGDITGTLSSPPRSFMPDHRDWGRILLKINRPCNRAARLRRRTTSFGRTVDELHPGRHCPGVQLVS